MFVFLVLQVLLVVAGAARYDQRVCLFSPDGRLLQAEYANEAANKGNLISCVVSAEGDFVLATPSQKLENFVDRRSVDKLSFLDDDLWMVFAGLAGDGRVVVQSARRFCINYRAQFGCSPSVAAVAKAVGGMLHRSTLSADSRPLGINVAIFGFDEANTPSIFVSRATGHVTHWRAFALGKYSPKALHEMDKVLHGDNDDVVAQLSTRATLEQLLSVMNRVHGVQQQDDNALKDKEEQDGQDGGESSDDALAGKYDVYVVRRRDTKSGAKGVAPTLRSQRTLFHPAATTVADLPGEWWL